MTDTPTPQDPAEAAPAAAVPVEEQLAAAEAKAEEHRNAWLRALADAENARKRAQADIAAAHKYGAERLVESLLPVMDSLEAALANASAGLESLRAGVELTQRQLAAALEKAGAAAIAPAPNERFDPHRHQAVAAVQAEAEPNTVLAVLQKGYRLHERVVRPAMVTVAKPAPQAETTPATGEVPPAA